jgi:hypothetical protein
MEWNFSRIQVGLVLAAQAALHHPGMLVIVS